MAAAIAAALLSVPAAAQKVEYVIPACPEVTVATMLHDLVEGGPDHNTPLDLWQAPSSLAVDYFDQGFEDLVDGQLEAAHMGFYIAGLDICLAQSSGASAADTYVIYQTGALTSTAQYRNHGVPVLVYKPSVTSQVGSNTSRVILSIPHAKSEAHLADELTAVAMNVSQDTLGRRAVRAAVVSTVHRCHHDDALTGPYVGGVDTTGCNGVMRVSDDAHNPDSWFQVMHSTLRTHFWNDQVAQIHGAGDDFGGISVSNGSGDQYLNAAQDTGHAVVRWYDELTQLAGSPANAEFTICHQYTAIPNHARPTGYFATQNRRCGTNSATRGEDPRLADDEASSSRQFHFVHLEIDSDLKDSGPERDMFVLSLGRLINTQ